MRFENQLTPDDQQKMRELLAQDERDQLLRELTDASGMAWQTGFSGRDLRLINNCSVYALHDPAGMPGHNLALIIAGMRGRLDALEDTCDNLKEALEGQTPVCPVCLEDMVRTHYQNEEGDWFVCWLCSCEPEPERIAEAERIAKQAR